MRRESPAPHPSIFFAFGRAVRLKCRFGFARLTGGMTRVGSGVSPLRVIARLARATGRNCTRSIFFMDVRLPKLGEGAESGTVVSILVKEGDLVSKGQTLLELENEKAVAPIPSP